MHTLIVEDEPEVAELLTRDSVKSPTDPKTKWPYVSSNINNAMEVLAYEAY